jgi:hypothetical protein
MGMYTGLRFKGIVKKEFRKDFKDIAMNGEWGNSKDIRFADFGKVSRASFIPCGALAYMPNEWENTDGFERTYNEESGFWSFQCSLKNYNDTIEEFLALVPYFIESVEHCEVFYEEWIYSEKYEMVGNIIVLTNDKFIQYGYED